MKKFLLSCLSIALLPAIAVANPFTSLGNGTNYTLESLSKIDTVGVTLESPGVYVMTEDVNIAIGDTFTMDSGVTLKMGNGVQLYAEGNVDFNCSQATFVTRNAVTDKPKGFYITTENPTDTIRVNNITFEYAGFRTWFVGKMNVTNCKFRNNNGANSSSAALVFGPSGGSYKVQNCEFENCEVPGIGVGGNVQVGLLIEDCVFTDNNTKNSNKPQINITVGGDQDVIIRNCTLKGAQRTKVGAIAVSNMMTLSGANNVLIEGCDIRDHRYGITTTHGPMNVVIKNNTMIDNKYETNAMNGGSGISLYDSQYVQDVYIEGNHIEGSLWGITIIGGKNVNVGKIDDPNAADYNPGKNVFINNGNGGVLYDLYNNGTNTVYAQGNTWNVNEQTAEKIETVITHKADNPALGEVIYMSEKSSIESIITDNYDMPVEYFTTQGIKTNNPTNGIYIKVQGGKASKVYIK